MRHLTLLLPLVLTSCWKLDATEIPDGSVAFDPESGSLSSWMITSIDLEIDCPDNNPAQAFLVHPSTPDTADGPMPVVVLYHSGAFDYVLQQRPNNPASGVFFSTGDLNGHLDYTWAVTKIYATLGMTDPFIWDNEELHDGSLPLAFAEQGVAVMMPMNCWGDMWHNFQGVTPNDYASDGYYRNGNFVLGQTWDLLENGGSDKLPIEVDSDRLYAAGLGEGGRAVGELLALGGRPVGVLYDSTAEDLRPYYNNESTYSDYVEGLNRIYATDGKQETKEAMLAEQGWLPERMVYVYSSLDPFLPSTAQASALGVLDGLDPETVWVDDQASAGHVFSNRDLDKAREYVAFLLDTEPVIDTETQTETDTESDTEVPDLDGDDDGYDQGEDCNDGNEEIYPGAPEADNGQDDDCDGLVDEDFLNVGDIILTEQQADPAAVADDVGEWFELYNTTSREIDLTGWQISAAANSITVSGPLKVAPGGYVVLAAGDASVNGGFTPDYTYDQSQLPLSEDGWFFELSAGGTGVFSLDFWAGKIKEGISTQLDAGSLDNAGAQDRNSWCKSTTTMSSGDLGTPGAPNESC